MVQPTEKNRNRAEKLSLLAGMLGPEAMERVRSRISEKAESGEAVDPDRVEWHRNRLLQRLRAKAKTGTSASQPHDRSDFDKRLNVMIDQKNIHAEHPAVIARLLTSMEREERTQLLKSLPGPMARNLLRRVRNL